MKVVAAAILVLALVIGIVPFFTDCESQGRMIELPNGRQISMKCHWTGRGELALAAPLFGVGALMTVGRRQENLRSLSLLGIVLGVLTILLPTALIGVCADPAMICNAVMRPALILSGTLVIVASAMGLILSMRREETAA